MKHSKAVVHERHKRILEFLEQRKTLRVAETGAYLQVSEITIRRDLDELEKKGLLCRFHGGARLTDTKVGLKPDQREQNSAVNLRKQQIAQIAAKMVSDNSTVFLNAGSTTLEVLRHIMRRQVRIVTNNAIATSIPSGGAAELICTGGEYNEWSHSFIGELAIPLLNRIYADTTILGVNGISSQYGITTHNYKETPINDVMMKRCNGKKIVVADGSKIGKIFCFTSFDLSGIDILVTDSSADAEELEKIKESGIEIILADRDQHQD